MHLMSFSLYSKQVEQGKFCLGVAFFLVVTCTMIMVSQNLFEEQYNCHSDELMKGSSHFQCIIVFSTKWAHFPFLVISLMFHAHLSEVTKIKKLRAF